MIELAIEKTILTYVDGYLNAKKEALEKAFFSETVLHSVDDGKIFSFKMENWLENIEQRHLKGDLFLMLEGNGLL